jgi:hypothetical protein
MSERRLLVLALLTAGCAETIDPEPDRPLRFAPERPATTAPVPAAPYTGADPFVLEAQRDLPTGLDLHAKVIVRTCSPNGGVCHNSKEYPDLHTPANFLALLGAPCNVQPGTPEKAFDRCERPGDRLRLGEEREVEVGYLDFLPGELGRDTPKDASAPGLHIHLAAPILEGKRDVYGTARFVRSFVTAGGEVRALDFATFRTRFWVLTGGTHLLGEVPRDRADEVRELLSVGILQGDLNRNGVYGARAGAGGPVPLLAPGAPESSYLIGRMRGLMKAGDQEIQVPGTRMPLANQPLSIPEMLALYCFVEGLAAQPAPPNLASAIDYVRCSYSRDPSGLNLLGAGVSWRGRVKNILDFRCTGCHSGNDPQGGLDLSGDGAYARLLAPSKQQPSAALLVPGDPAASYLWRKLAGEPGIVGARMPLDAQGAASKLDDAELRDLRAWIEAGAVERE